MWKSIIFLFIILLSIIGISEVICFLGSLFFKPKNKPKKYLLVYLSDTCAEEQILSELFNLRWFGEKLARKIIFITDNLDAQEAKRLEKEYKSDIAEFKNGVFNERAK